MATFPGLRAFIVHGHDHAFRDEVVRHLEDELKFERAVVLDAVASMGRTVIEKFEQESSQCDLAIVLLTPDDEAKTTAGQSYRTARPNVWIELGYFMAHFGRTSGRTILLFKRGLEIPTDLAGVTYVDASAGLEDENVSRRIETELDKILEREARRGLAPRAGASVPLGADLRIEGTVRFTETPTRPAAP